VSTSRTFFRGTPEATPNQIMPVLPREQAYNNSAWCVDGWGGKNETWRFSGTGQGAPELSPLPQQGIDTPGNYGSFWGVSEADFSRPAAATEGHEAGFYATPNYGARSGPGPRLETREPPEIEFRENLKPRVTTPDPGDVWGW
jgi:hypothetical protein